MTDDYGSSSSSSGSGSSGGGIGSTILGILSSILLLLGSVLAVLFFFLCLMDNVKVARINAQIHVGEMKLTRGETGKELKKIELEQRKLDSEPFDNNPDKQKSRNDRADSLRKRRTEASEKQEKARESWDKEKMEFESNLDKAEDAAAGFRPWGVMVMMIGFLLIIGGGFCLCCISDRRIVGAIVIHAALAGVFSVVMFFLSALPGSRGPFF